MLSERRLTVKAAQVWLFCDVLEMAKPWGQKRALWFPRLQAGRGLTAHEREGIGGDGIVNICDCGGNHTTPFICQNSQHCLPKGQILSRVNHILLLKKIGGFYISDKAEGVERKGIINAGLGRRRRWPLP